MQQSQQIGFGDMQMYQQQLIFKELQELRRQPQLPEVGDARLQNYINQLSAINKQNNGGQFQPLPLINGTPVHDASQMLMVGNTHAGLQGAPQSVQEFPNGFVRSQARSQALGSMRLLPQQLDASLFGSPICSPKYNVSPYSHLQGICNDSANELTKYSEDQAKAAVQSPAFSKPFLGGHLNVPSDQLCMPDGASISKQVCRKSCLGQVPIGNSTGGVLTENFAQVNSLQKNASLQEFSGREEHAGWPGLFPVKPSQFVPSQKLATLDPLEEKFLFNIDDTGWDNSLGMSTGNFGDTSECTEYLGSLPSIQSGSWSALMQSAVAEVSSSDTGLQEDWSGLSFQNTEMSTDNQPSSFVDSGIQQTGWVDNNTQSVSSLSSESLVNDSSMSSIFPGFQQPNIHFPIKQREVMLSTSPHESFEQSVNDASKWSDCNYQQKQPTEGGQPAQILQPLENAWPCQNKLSKNDTNQQSIFSYTSSNLSDDKPIGENIASLSPSGNGLLNICSENNTSQYIIAGHEITENVWQCEGDSRPMAGSNQKLSRQVSQASSSRRPGYLGQFTSAGNVTNDIMGLEKGTSHDIQRNSKVSKEVPPIGNSGSNLSASFQSQHMLKLHQADHEREHNTVTHFGSTDSKTLSELPKAETPDISQQYNPHSASQRSGSRLAHPFQQLPNSNSCFSSQSSICMVGTTSPSGPGLGNQLQRQNLPAAQQTLSTIASRLPYFDHTTSQDTFHSISTNPFGQQFTTPEPEPITQPSVMSVMPQQVGFSTRPPSTWPNASTQQHLAGMEPSRLPSSSFLSTDSTRNSRETTTWVPKEDHNQNFNRGTSSVEFDACSMNSLGTDCGEERHWKERSQQQISSEIVDPASVKGGSSRGQEFVAKHVSEVNSMASNTFMECSNQQHIDRAQQENSRSLAVSARDLDDFGRSLKPSDFLHKNHSLLRQVQSVKNVETDTTNRVFPKHNEASPENLLNDVRNTALQRNLYPTRDMKMMNFSSEVKEHQSVIYSSQHRQHTPQEMLTLVQSYPERHSSSSDVLSNMREFPQVSLEMAPSWFQSYGTLKSGQNLPMYCAGDVKNAAQQFPPRKPFGNLHTDTSAVNIDAAEASLIGTFSPTTAPTMVVGKRASPYVLPLGVPDQNLAVVRPKRRKIATSELLPWHKEVTQGFQRLEIISKAEIEWAKAANQLIEKVEDEAKMAKPVQPTLRSKRRLILTTQLMQQVFRPTPATILSAEAASNYETVAYFTARLALGDACCLLSCSRSDACLSSNHCVTMYVKPKVPENNNEQCFLKIVEDYTDRTKKLEIDLLRVEKGASILDFRVECQELEKFSFFNRFAKFHTRDQGKPGPQRYVTAFPMPGTIPEGAQCLSL